MMTNASLILVLGDQLTMDRGALKQARPGEDVILMAEVKDEALYVKHNKHKIVLIFAAMRHFCEQLRTAGFEVVYFDYDAGLTSLYQAVQEGLKQTSAVQLRVCEPGEYRLQQDMQSWSPGVPMEWVQDDRFLATAEEFAAWAEGRKQLRMEYFYRLMRRKYHLLLDEQGQPEGGKWNFDAENRKGWRGQESIPERSHTDIDAITAKVITLVDAAFADHPGDLSQFRLAVTTAAAEAQFEEFLQRALPMFGRYQDALTEDSEWLFHSLISMYINIGLLDPLTVCQHVEAHWRAGHCELSAAEGFIRQILGWREYVRGIYWLFMPDYKSRNTLAARHPLPDWFWTANTDLRCLHRALQQSLDHGYAHHIQRLMVIGNFALLAGLDVDQVCDWYLAVYSDAFEWVELPNTLGMALYGDGGVMASKPYAASGKYLQRQGDHCKQCRYSPSQTTGENACPYNSLYWSFLHRNQDHLQNNPRMGLALANWKRKPEQEQAAILQWADHEQSRLL